MTSSALVTPKLQDAIALFHEREPGAGARLVLVSVLGRLAVPYHLLLTVTLYEGQRFIKRRAVSAMRLCENKSIKSVL